MISKAVAVQTGVCGHSASPLFNQLGQTPLVTLQRVVPPRVARVLVKCEFLNPLASVKDRIGAAMIEDAERRDALYPGCEIIEPTSGNTGIALAWIAAAKGYPLTLTMPDSMSHERRALLRALGANLILTPATDGISGAIRAAHALYADATNAWMPRQFDNPANPAIHEATTGPEIAAAAGGIVDILVAGVGTGGTLTGVSRYLRTLNPNLVTVAVEPAESPVISGGVPGRHPIQGIGAGFIPQNLDRSLISEVQTVSGEEAFAWARRLAREEGLLVGISTGANIAAAARLAGRRANAGKTIVTFACSSGERYLSTPLYQFIGYQGPQDCSTQI